MAFLTSGFAAAIVVVRAKREHLYICAALPQTRRLLHLLSRAIEDWELIILDLESDSDIISYTTTVFSECSDLEYFDYPSRRIFLGPYYLDGSTWRRTETLNPGTNNIIALLDLPRLSSGPPSIVFRAVLHYTKGEENLQSAVLDFRINARQLLSEELIPKFQEESFSGQEIFSCLASSGLVLELRILPSGQNVMSTLLEALQSEMNFRPLKNSSKGWLVHVGGPTALAHGVLLKFRKAAGDGETRCLIAAKNDEQLLLLVQAFYMVLPGGFAFMSERSRLHPTEHCSHADQMLETKKRIVCRSLQKEMSILQQIMDRHSERSSGDVDKRIIRKEKNYYDLVNRLVDQELITNRIIAKCESNGPENI